MTLHGGQLLTEADVVVVGGGPAGLSVAERVAGAGLSIVLFEKNDAIGVPIRTSGGSWVSAMQDLRVPPALYHPIRRLRFLSTRSEAVFSYEASIGCVLDVRRLYQHLAERAVSAGATIRLKARVEKPLVRANTVVGVAVKDGRGGLSEVSAKVVIDASGYTGLIGKRVGIHPGLQRFGFGVEYDLYAPHYDESEAMLMVGDEVAPNGYAWAFPYGNHRVRLGVGVVRPETDCDPRVYLDQLPDRVPALRRACEGASPIEYHIGLVPIVQPGTMPFAADGLVIVGDAAGQASTMVGEGIRFAMHSGYLAAETVVEAFRARDYSRAVLGRYEHAWRRTFGRNMRVAYELHKRFTQYTNEDWEDKIQILQKLTPRQFAQGLKGDFSIGWALDIGFHNPDLAGRALRAVTSRMLGRFRQGIHGRARPSQ